MNSFPLEMTNIELGYGQKPVIENLSLSLQPGSLIGLIGPNGAGKTTLLLAASGQFRPARGTISCGGMDIYQDNLAYKYHTGYVHEVPYAWPWLTVAEFLAFTGRVKKVAIAEIPAQIDQLLQAVLLEAERQKLTGDLSQGMRKKLAIAAAFMGQPPLVFLDEALNGVDIESVYAIKQLLRSHAQAGGTVILSTHVLEVIEKLCDHYVVLQSGRVIADLDAAEWKAGHGQRAGGLEEYIMALLQGNEPAGRVHAEAAVGE